MPTSHPSSRLWVAGQLQRLDLTSVLDVGPGDGTYGRMVRDVCGPDVRLTCVEVWSDYVGRFGLDVLYDEVVVDDVRRFGWDGRWDLTVFGDVIEHMPRQDALDVWQRACDVSSAVLVVVPIVEWPQHGHVNPYETHVETWTHRQAMDAFVPSEWWVGDLVGAYVTEVGR